MFLSTQTHTPRKRGSVLIFTLILMSLALMSAIGIMSTTIIEQNIASVTDDSTVAFQTADTGAEQAFHEFRKDRIATLNDFTGASCSGGRVSATNVDGVAGASYDINFYKEDGSRVTSCSADTKPIRAARVTGYFGKAVRAVEIAVSVPTDDITSGLVAHWPFDSDMGDVKGGHNGRAYGGAHISTSGSPVGAGMLSLDGTNDYVVVPRDSDFNFSENDSYTITFWVYFDSVSGKQAPLHKRLGYYLESNNIQWDYQGITPNISRFRIDAGKWYHVVLWQDGDTRSRALYINGKRAKQKASIRASRNKMIYFGVADVGGSYLTRYFGGKIDDVRIYNRALSPIEILVLCQNEFDGNTPVSGVTCGE